MLRFRNLLTRPRLHGLAVAAGLLATIGSTFSVYPHQLAYFNEAAGGPKNGHSHLLHSNLDWGQDLLYFRHWAEQCQVGTELVGIALDSPCKPPDLGIRCVFLSDWVAGKAPAATSSSQSSPLLIVSITRHENALAVGYEPKAAAGLKILDLGEIAKEMQVVDQIGYSLRVLQ